MNYDGKGRSSDLPLAIGFSAFRGVRMLKLTKKADYALMAMKHLADHAHEGTRSASAKDVADSFGIPPEALAKILQRLVKAGLLQSQHGTNGGYRLARAAHTISAFEVIQAIDGPLFITSCFKGVKACDLTPSCTIKEPLARVNETIIGVLKSISIQDLAEQEHAAVKAQEPQRLVSLTL